MSYRLGVDLGTTYTVAAVHRDGEARPAVVELGNAAAALPTVVHAAGGRVLVGEAAEARAVEDPTHVARESKRRLGDDAPVLLGTDPWSPQQLLAAVLAHVLARVAELEGGPPDSLTLTHPAGWGGHRLERFRSLAALAGYGGPVVLVPEPLAAAAWAASAERWAPGTVVAVYDLGGGTFDAAVVRIGEGGAAEVLGVPAGLERFGGVDVDAAVLAHVRAQAPAPFEHLDDGDDLALASLQQVRDAARRAKERLSEDVGAAVLVSLPSGSAQVRITRAELEAAIAPDLDRTIEVLERALADAGVERPDRVLLVGGSSRMPAVAATVAGRLGVPVSSDANPNHAIALGAALSAPRPAVAPVAPSPAPVAAAAPAGPPPSRPTALVVAGAMLAVALVAVVAGVLLTRGGDGAAAGATTSASTSTTTSAPGVVAGTGALDGTTTLVIGPELEDTDLDETPALRAASFVALVAVDGGASRWLFLPDDLLLDDGSTLGDAVRAGTAKAVDAVRSLGVADVDHVVRLRPGFLDVVRGGHLRTTVDVRLSRGEALVELAPGCTDVDQPLLGLLLATRFVAAAGPDGRFATDPTADLGRMDRQQAVLDAAVRTVGAGPLADALLDDADVDQTFDSAARADLAAAWAAGGAYASVTGIPDRTEGGAAVLVALDDDIAAGAAFLGGDAPGEALRVPRPDSSSVPFRAEPGPC